MLDITIQAQYKCTLEISVLKTRYIPKFVVLILYDETSTEFFRNCTKRSIKVSWNSKRSNIGESTKKRRHLLGYIILCIKD